MACNSDNRQRSGNADAMTPALVDMEKMSRSRVVLQVALTARHTTSSKHAFETAKVIQVFKNESNEAIGEHVEIAHDAWKSGLPEAECTAYLEVLGKYDESYETHVWILLGGSGEEGVSHFGARLNDIEELP